MAPRHHGSHREPLPQRGPFWTPITPPAGSLFHAETQFLPIVSRVDRHQAAHPPPPRLLLDALGEAWGGTTLGRVAREAFATAPAGTRRERDAFMLALMTAGWGRGTRS